MNKTALFFSVALLTAGAAQVKAQQIVVSKTNGTTDSYAKSEVKRIDQYENVELPATCNRVFTVKGVKFTMVPVKGGTFQMGGTPEQGSNVMDYEKPIHQVTLSSYYIGQTEVTQELWYAVTGERPSSNSWTQWTRDPNMMSDQYPAFLMNYDIAQEFIGKLNALTGLTFRLPTEAEWEFAARGGKKSKGYKFAGSNDADEVAWHCGNSQDAFHPVALKKPNELGLFDMSGNIIELSNDWYGGYPSAAVTNPTGPESGSVKVRRGGSYSTKNGDGTIRIVDDCHISKRWSPSSNSANDRDCGLRLAITSVPKTTGKAIVITKTDGTKVWYNALEVGSITLSGSATKAKNCTFTVCGVPFTMVRVDGGTFQMGATADQGSKADASEKPVHQVTLSTYYIGQTEVTQQLWQAVMGHTPNLVFDGTSYAQWGVSEQAGSRTRGDENVRTRSIGSNILTKKGDNYPANYISWDDCQAFVKRLSALTGCTFRLPTEAEWEFAARGGKKSKGYMYSGSNTLTDVMGSGYVMTEVATKQANELGLYDMSGSLWEWCSDWYSYSYDGGAQTNPTGAETGTWRITRGGAFHIEDDASRVAFRYGYLPGSHNAQVGLRLVMETPQVLMIGDANGDWKVDAADIVEVGNHVKGKASKRFVKTASNINNDGVVDKKDMEAIGSLILIIGK